jgi:hypothetical protein
MIGIQTATLMTCAGQRRLKQNFSNNIRPAGRNCSCMLGWNAPAKFGNSDPPGIIAAHLWQSCGATLGTSLGRKSQVCAQRNELVAERRQGVGLTRQAATRKREGGNWGRQLWQLEGQLWNWATGDRRNLTGQLGTDVIFTGQLGTDVIFGGCEGEARWVPVSEG